MRARSKIIAPYFRVKSDLPLNKITFNELIFRLRAFIRYRISSGEFTERSLARILGISQPHFHNMLKGARRLTIEFADRIMAKFDITIFDLMSFEEMWNYLDDVNPEWTDQALKRKPPVQAAHRSNVSRTGWRTPRGRP
jgi:plasmid maintenance system antidote protein VapI